MCYNGIMSKKHRKNFESHAPNAEAGREVDAVENGANIRAEESAEAKTRGEEQGVGAERRTETGDKERSAGGDRQAEAGDGRQGASGNRKPEVRGEGQGAGVGGRSKTMAETATKTEMKVEKHGDAGSRMEARAEAKGKERDEDERRAIARARDELNAIGAAKKGREERQNDNAKKSAERKNERVSDGLTKGTEAKSTEAKSVQAKVTRGGRQGSDVQKAAGREGEGGGESVSNSSARGEGAKNTGAKKVEVQDAKTGDGREKRRERAHLKVHPTREDREHAEILATSSAAGVVGVEVVAGGARTGAKPKQRAKAQEVKPDAVDKKNTGVKAGAVETAKREAAKKSRKTDESNTRAAQAKKGESRKSAEGESSTAKSEKRQGRESKRVLRKQRRANRPRKHTMPAALRILCAVLLLAGMAVIFDWFVLWRQNMGDFGATLEFIDEKPLIFAYSGVVIFMLMAVIAAVTWRVCLTVGLSFSIVSIITYVNMQKMELRNAPLLPDDLLLADQAGGLMQFIDVWSIVRLAGGVVLILIGTILLERCVRRVIGRETKGLPWWDKMVLVPRTAFTMAALAGLAGITSPIINREQPEWLAEELTTEDWNPTATYERNGFIVGFLYNLGNLNTPKPEDYNEETMKEIAQRYRAMKLADEDRVPMNEVIDNLIVILDESFYDPALFTKYYKQAGGDITPNLHRIFQEYPSGYMYSPEYGGNTANVEFEVFTSLSNYWARTFPYVHSIPKSDGVLGIPDWTKNFGFDTLAIHSYDGNMYKRNLVYPRIGFNDFIDADKMSFMEYEFNSEYINDASVFAEVLAALENSDEPMMIGAITMQNHMPYDYAGYPTLDFSVTNMDYYLLEADFQSIYMADQYVGEFLEALDELDERTVVLWFGDHAAALLDEYINSEDKDDRNTAHLTPYFIYANFDIESEFTEAEVREMNAEQGFEFPTRIRGIDLPVMSPNCLQNTMYDILGVEKPSVLYLVDEVCRETPILTAAYVADEALEVTQALRDYELVNYDALSGEHYWDEE